MWDPPLLDEDLGVRRSAVSEAAEIVVDLVQGGARVPDGPCYFTQFGCDQTVMVKYDYDPGKEPMVQAVQRAAHKLS